MYFNLFLRVLKDKVKNKDSDRPQMLKKAKSGAHMNFSSLVLVFWGVDVGTHKAGIFVGCCYL